MAKGITEFLNYRLAPTDLERRYREEKFTNDKTRIATILIFAVFVLCGYIFLEFCTIPKGNVLYVLAASRGATAILALLAIWMILKHSTIKSFDLIVLSWVLGLVLHLMVVGAIRPEDYVIRAAWDILVIFGIYAALTIPLSLQMLSALLLSFGSAALWLIQKPFPVGSEKTVDILIAYSVTNILGIFISIKFKRSDRKHFVLLMDEREARAKLEIASAEMKVLRGIIPICAYCKKIRNVEGYYEEVEGYVMRHSEADFSHTYCPECIEKHHPEFHEHLLSENAEQDAKTDDD